MKLVLGADYPQAPPKGFFLTKIYHPNVSSNGDICVNTLKKDWNEKVTLCHILAVIRCLLIVPFPESSLNDEAGKVRHCATHMHFAIVFCFLLLASFC
jgi:ubiquitin-conjugating enzyme E2 S